MLLLSMRSNYPMIAPEAALADLDALQLDDETRELFLAGNARRVFGLDAAAPTRRTGADTAVREHHPDDSVRSSKRSRFRTREGQE